MVTQGWIGGHIHCRQKHRKYAGLLRECEQRAQWHLYHLNNCPPDHFTARDSMCSTKASPQCHISVTLQNSICRLTRDHERSHVPHWSLQMQLPANSDTADAKRPKDRRADAEFSVSVWLALLLCLGLAFSYIILQRKEAPITGKANADLWGMHTSLCTCSACLWPIRMPGTFLFGFRFHHLAQHAVSGEFG